MSLSTACPRCHQPLPPNAPAACPRCSPAPAAALTVSWLSLGGVLAAALLAAVLLLEVVLAVSLPRKNRTPAAPPPDQPTAGLTSPVVPLTAVVDGDAPLLGSASELLLFHTGKSASGPDLELVADAPARERAPAPVAALVKLEAQAAPKVHDAERLAALAALGKVTGDRASATKEKDVVYAQVVDRFIQYDVGLLAGADGQTALMNFQNLGPDSIRAVVYGLNRSATIEASCPIYVISRKLITLLQACDDLETLAYARSHMGQGLGYSIHGASVQAVRQVAEQRYQVVQFDLARRIPEFVTALRHDDPRVRHSAAVALGAVPPAALKSIPADLVPDLAAALRDKEPIVRRHAAFVLGFPGSEAKAAVPALVAALTDADRDTRAYAARALATTGPAAVPALVEAMNKQEDREARALACLALGESRPAGDEAVRAVAAALKDPDAGQRGAARQALVALGPAAVPALIAALKNGESGAALALGQMEPPAAAAVPALVAALKAPDKEVRLEVHEALVRLGPVAVPAMAEALGDADVRTWHSLSVALGKIGPAASAATPALATALTHPDRNVRLLAASALTKIDPDSKEIRPVLEEAAPIFLEALSHPDAPLRAWAVQSLGKMGINAAVGPLTQALRDPDGQVRARAAEALGGFGAEARDSVGELIAVQKDAEPRARAAAQTSLTRLGTTAVQPLIAALSDPRQEIHDGSAAVLQRIGPPAVPALAGALTDGDVQIRRGVAAVLKKLGPDGRDAIPALIEALHDGDREVRLNAAGALGEVKPETRDAPQALLAFLQDPDEVLRSIVWTSLVRTGMPAVADLGATLKDADAGRRAGAATVLKKIGAEARPAIPALAEALRDADKEVRIQAIDALREIVNAPQDGELDASGRLVLQSFVTALHDPDAEVRRAGQLGLIRLRKLAVPALAELLKDPDVPVRQQAIEVGKKLGPDARMIVPALVGALRDADKDVRDGSGWALTEIDPELKEALPALQRALAGPAPAKGIVKLRTTNLGYLTAAELMDAAGGTSGVALKELLQELARRRGQNVLVTLLLATTCNDAETRQLAHRLVFEYLSQKPDEGQEEDAGRRLGFVKRLLEEGRPDVAQKRLQELLASYPRTHAGEEVRELLARVK